MLHIQINKQTHTHAHAHAHTHPFNGPFPGTTWVGRYEKGKTNLDFTEARDSEWKWHQLGHMQVCTLLQTDNHASNSPLRSSDVIARLCGDHVQTASVSISCSFQAT